VQKCLAWLCSALHGAAMSVCTDEFEDEGFMEKSMTEMVHIKSDTVSTAGETSAAKESRKESRKISVSAMEPRKRTREEEEYIPQPVRN